VTLAEMRVAPQYTESLAHGGALVDQMRILVREWRSDETTPDFIRRVRESGILGHATARTVSEYVRVFARRFVAPPGPPVFHLQRMMVGSVSPLTFNDLALYYTAAQDDLLLDFTVRCYWPLAREGRLTISREDARRFIWDGEADGLMRAPWSEAVKRDMPMRLLNALAEFGLRGPLRLGRRAVMPYRPSDLTLLYIAYLMHENGITDGNLAAQRDWTLFGLEPRDVWHRLEHLDSEKWFLIQRAGEVVRITWRYARLEDAVDALS
jgi:hypothetical protein